MNTTPSFSLPKTLLTKIEHVFDSQDMSHISLNQAFNTIIHYYENILNCMPGNVYWLDQHCRGLGCNQNVLKMFGMSSITEFRGLTFEEMGKIGRWSKEATQAFEHDSMEVIRTGRPKLNVEEPPIPDHDGALIYFLSHRVPLFDEHKTIIGLLGISIDITQRTTLEKELIHQKQKTDAANAFIANMSHDVRTPLNGVIGMSRLLEERIESQECKQYARWIHESGNQLMLLLNSILDLVSADHFNEQAIHAETFSIQSLINDIIQLEQPSTLIKKIAFTVDIEKDIPKYVVADRTKLHRILLNLIGNAIQFTKAGTIEIHVHKAHQTTTHSTLNFSISDTGIGIPKHLQSKIFDRFFKLTPSSKREYAGYGVGLNIVQNYIKLLGGTLHLFSEEGKGSTFSFQLTFKKGTSEQQENEPITVTSSTLKTISLPTLHFLLIEDNLIALKLLEHLIERLGYTYCAVKTAEEALAQLHHQTFELIICDIGLPGLSGIELTKKIRQTLKSHPPIIIGLTAHASQKTYENCLNAGMNTVLTKPLDIQKMSQVLNTFLPPSPTITPPTSLGRDLPATEAALFQMDSFTLLDAQQAIELLGSQAVLKDMLQLMINEQFPHDLPLLKSAYQQKDWKKTESLAHKMKAGALYCGTVRLQMACQYLERYQKAGHSKSLEALYKQLMQVIKATQKTISQYLKKT